MKTIAVGDVHGETKELARILRQYPDDNVIQVGDLGVGFPDFVMPKMGRSHRFIHGNHDNPTACSGHPNYMGRFGYEIDTGIFFVSGGFSIDAHKRTPGLDWWPNEQLNMEEMATCILEYEDAKPKIVISHDAPIDLYPQLIEQRRPGGLVYENSTAYLLKSMMDVHQPDIHIFGHWHISFRKKIGKTQFIGLNILETFEIPEGIYP